jgi:hypothetical protein
VGPIDVQPEDRLDVEPLDRLDVTEPPSRILLRNLFRNPAIKRDLREEIDVLKEDRVSPVAPPGPMGAAAPAPDRMESLLARVESLETELAALKKPARTRKAPAKPEK